LKVTLKYLFHSISLLFTSVYRAHLFNKACPILNCEHKEAHHEDISMA